MSEYIPFEMQEQIIKKLPVKAVIQCRCVSKSWKSLIDSSKFVAGYEVRHTQPQSLLLRYKEALDSQEAYVRVIDDDTFPNQKHSLTVPLIVKQLKDSIPVGSCHGLYCLYGPYWRRDDWNSEPGMAVIWNPSIRKVVAVPIPKLKGVFKDVFGFGVCPATNEPKIIRICDGYSLDRTTCISRKAEIFTLSTGTWTTLSSNLPHKSIEFTTYHVVVVERFVYWSACDRDYGGDDMSLIISFDLIDGEFGQVYLPDGLQYCEPVFIFKSRDSLALIRIRKEGCEVWMMEEGVPKSFVMLFSISVNELGVHMPDVFVRIMGFQKTGKPILQLRCGGELFVVVVPPVVDDDEPSFERVNKIQCDADYYPTFLQPGLYGVVAFTQSAKFK